MPERRYPRTARVNKVLLEVVADVLERVADHDERLSLVTVTSVDIDPDLRHARVFYASRDEEGVGEALIEQRVRLQAAIARQVRLKRTPQLSFLPDPAVTSGERVESILRQIPPTDPPSSEPA